MRGLYDSFVSGGNFVAVSAVYLMGNQVLLKPINGQTFIFRKPEAVALNDYQCRLFIFMHPFEKEGKCFALDCHYVGL